MTKTNRNEEIDVEAYASTAGVMTEYAENEERVLREMRAGLNALEIDASDTADSISKTLGEINSTLDRHSLREIGPKSSEN